MAAWRSVAPNTWTNGVLTVLVEQEIELGAIVAYLTVTAPDRLPTHDEAHEAWDAFGADCDFYTDIEPGKLVLREAR